MEPVACFWERETRFFLLGLVKSGVSRRTFGGTAAPSLGLEDAAARRRPYDTMPVVSLRDHRVLGLCIRSYLSDHSVAPSVPV